MDRISTNIKERVLEFAKYQSVSIESFLREIGMTYGSFKGKAKEGTLNSNAIAKIMTLYSEINITWLLTGEGRMLITGNQKGEKTLELEKKDWEIDRLKEENLQLKTENAHLNKTIGKLESQLEISDISYKSNVG